MGTYNLLQIEKIILNNPNKELVVKGQKICKKLKMHLYGKNIKDYMKREDYFENADIYKQRTESPTSNRDVFARLLQQEDMIFSTRGGSTAFNGLNPDSEKTMNTLLSNVRYNLSLRNWVKNFALPAYRSDPMGLIFIEIEQLLQLDGAPINTPKCYPTYKSINSVWDYLPNGRQLEYVCFQLLIKELPSYGIIDTEAVATQDNKDKPPSEKMSPYYRFVDDSQDIIVKKQDDTVVIATNTKVANPIPNPWGKVPAIIVSDLIQFDDPTCFSSPISFIVELADSFIYDRSIRDLQKKYHGFAKAIEPLLSCPTCDGTGLAKGSACPDCTPVGQDRGTGYKLKTKISDVAKFPLEILEKGNFDYKKIFGYVAPDIETWNKQDANLIAIEGLMYQTYWGTQNPNQTSGAGVSKSSSAGGGISADNTQETATKTLVNLQPKYARLNAIADWAERMENIIADMIGKFWFQDSFKESQIIYGRNWILETPVDLWQQYSDMRTAGAPDFLLDEALERYIRALYQNAPNTLAKYLKLLKVEPFPHVDVKNCLPPGSTPVNGSIVIPNDDDYLMKVYFGEWYSTLQEVYIIKTDVVKLKQDLLAYVEAKEIEEDDDNSEGDKMMLQKLQTKLLAATTPEEKQAIQNQIDALSNAKPTV